MVPWISLSIYICLLIRLATVGDALAQASKGIALIQVEASQHTSTISAETGLMHEDTSTYEDTSHGRFHQAWVEAISDPIMVEYFRSKQPRAMDEQDFEFSPEPSQFSYFIWDAIQSAGFAMCMTENTEGSPFFAGPDVYSNFANNITFEGASGDVGIDSSTGTRDAVGVTYTVWNARSTSTEKAGIVGFDLHPTSYILPVRQASSDQKPSIEQRFKIVEIEDFIYNDGTAQQPGPLPNPVVNYNYIGDAGRIVGYVLMGIVIVLALAGLVWAIVMRKERVVRASQPTFLAFVSFGCILMSAAIVPHTMEETTVQSDRGLDIACMSAPWIYALGFVFTFAALLTKTYAVYKVFRKPDIHSVTGGPLDTFKTLAVLLVVNVAILLSWTLVAPLTWVRVEGDSKDAFERSTDSWATCSPESGTKALPFVVTWIVFNLGSLIFAIVLAYRGRDVETDHHENRYIAISMASILQAWAMGIPIMIVVRDSPQARFFVELGIIFVTCSAILLLVYVPKILSVRTDRKKQMEEERRNTRRHVSSRVGRSPESDSEEEEEEDDDNVGNPQAGVESVVPAAMPSSSTSPLDTPVTAQTTTTE